MVAMVKVVCGCCKTTFSARRADVNRGWGKFCSKSCKAKKQEARTGQYVNMFHKVRQKILSPTRTTSIFDPYENDEEDNRPMSQEELAMGGYGDADWDTPLHDGKF